MSEIPQPTQEQLFLGEHNPVSELDVELYYLLKASAIQSGAKTWMVRNLDFESRDGGGKVYGLFFLGSEIALVDDESGAGECRVYVKTYDEEVIAIAETTSVWQAVEIAEQHHGISEL